MNNLLWHAPLPQTIAALALTGSVLGACVDNKHPYTGTVVFRHDDAALYSTDVFDDDGVAQEPRQTPYEKTIDISMAPNGEPDFGAYVDLEVSPPGALLMRAIDDRCEQLQGIFRCTAGEDGHAQFTVSASSTYVGTAQIKTVGKSPTDETSIVVREPGLHNDVEFTLDVAQGGSGAQKIAATFVNMKCSLSADEGGNQFDKWPMTPRVVEAQLRAVRKTGASIENAPVFIDVLDSEAFVTTDPFCLPPRTSRIRLSFDEQGLAPTFYFCFSDLGGSVEVKATSGSASEQSATFNVDPEPRLLRVVTSKTSIGAGESNTLIEVSSYDASLNRLAFDVDIKSTDPTVLSVPTITNALNVSNSIQVAVEGVAAGTAGVAVSPALYDMPSCTSETITVTDNAGDPR